ncbi:MAG: PAS domain S-box protein [Syntrophales bacterium]
MMKGNTSTPINSSNEMDALRYEVEILKQEDTTNKQTIAALQKSEAYFRAITQNSSDLIIIVDREGTITYVNPATERLLGYQLRELIGRSGFDFVAPEELARALADYCEATQTKDVIIPNAFTIKHKDGSVRILEGVGNNLLDHPDVAGFVMNVRDITERRRMAEELAAHREGLECLVAERTAELSRINSQLCRELDKRQQVEEALRESEEKYRNFMEDAPMGICIVDTTGKIQFINRTIEEHSGWRREELLGKDGFTSGFFNDETRRLLAERLAARLRGDPPQQLEILLSCKDREPLWVVLKTTLLQKDGLIVGAQIAFTDISDRRRVEGALRESEGKFRDMAEKAVVGIYLVQDDRFKYVNAKFAEILSYPMDALIDKAGPKDVIVPEDWPLVEENIRKRISGEVESCNYGFSICTGDGQIRHAEVYSSRTIFQGRPAVIGTLLDVTGRKKREKELALKNRRLEDLNTTLKVLLEQRSEDKKEIEATLLTNIRGLVMPPLEMLKACMTDPRSSGCLALLEANLQDVLSPFLVNMKERCLNLTSKEIQIIQMIKQGKTTKEIAQMLSLSPKTIDYHRANIRKKMDIKNKDFTLSSCLTSLL